MQQSQSNHPQLRMGDPMPKPEGAGVHRFEGIRKVPNRSQIVTVADFVLVDETQIGGDKGMKVSFFGKARVYPVDLFEGTWFRVFYSAKEKSK